MGGNISCVETVRSNGVVFLLDAKNREQGPVEMWPEADYAARHDEAVGSGDVGAMFSHPDVQAQFTAGELSAYRDYLAAGRLALATADGQPQLQEGVPVTAFEDRRDLLAVSVQEAA